MSTSVAASVSSKTCSPGTAEPSVVNRSYKDHLQVIKGFCDKADGKDKLTALIQYACMFLSANEPGQIKKVQASVTAARKIFRVMRPLESITPLLNQPGFKGPSPHLLQAINKLKSVLMAVYFGADHVVWAHQIGVVTNKQLGERAQKVSLYSWAMGSICTIVAEVWEINRLLVVRKDGESVADYDRRVTEAQRKIDSHVFLMVHAAFQTALAAGLLQLLPFTPRTVGFLGVVASAMNCYLLLPAYPAAAVKPKAA